MNEFEELIRLNENTLKKALELDNKKWGLNKNYKDIFDNNYSISLENNTTYLILYEGDINFTKLICEQAIKNEANVIFSINDEYLATNKVIIKIANEITKKNKLKNIIKLYNNVEDKKILNGSKEFDEVIFIGGAFEYTKIKDEIKCKCTFIKLEYEEE